MKRLIVMRHAKSDWSEDVNSDFDRPLNNRGLKAAPFMGEKLKELNIVPDLILSSSANRAKTTAELFAEANGYKNQIQFIDDFYYGIDEDIINTVKKVDNSVNDLMIVGHNPIMEELVYKLTNEDDFIIFKTATIVVLSVPVKKWSGLKEKICITQNIFKPDYK